MTGEEKRRLLKEQYKKDLQKRKAFLDQARSLRKMNTMNKSVSDIVDGFNQDDSDDWIQQLNQESALTEAKLEMALETAEDQQAELDRLAKEAEMEKFNAEEMVKQMKREMGLLTEEEEEKPEPPEAKSSEPTAEKEEKKEEDKPDKTLGDF